MVCPTAFSRPVGKFGIAPVVDTDGLENAEMGERQVLARALLIEAVAAVAAMVLSVGECECSSASHADIRVDPFRGLRASVFALVPDQGRITYCAAV